MTLQQQIVSDARRYLGVRFCHQGRSVQGLDCLGLLVCVARDCGLHKAGRALADFDALDYGHLPNATRLKNGLAQADILTLVDGTNRYEVRITRMLIGKPGRVRFTAVAEDALSYDAAPNAANDEVSAVVPLETPPTRLQFLDIPALADDVADEAPLRVALYADAPNWPGAVLYRSDDAGGSFNELARSSAAAMTGVALNALPDFSANCFDETSTLELALVGAGELSSVTEQALLNGANLLLLGEELLQFQFAEAIAPSTYRLSRLLRGRYGTEHATGGHSIGEAAVLVNGALIKINVPDGQIGLRRDFRAITFGKTLGSGDSQSFTYQARALQPYAPVHLKADQQTNGDCLISWVRRTRIGGQWRDGTDVPLGEADERYVLQLWAGGILLREETLTSAAYLYPSSQRVNDLPSGLGEINIKICQLAQRVGRGYFNEININFNV